MKITKLTTFVVPPRWLFLKIETDEGITGWGEPVVEGRAETVAALVAELADYLIGKDPGAIEDHWTVLYRGGFYRGGALHMSALAGIDQALWDIKGKALGQPVHALLGGPCATRSGSIAGSAATGRPKWRRARKDVAARGLHRDQDELAPRKCTSSTAMPRSMRRGGACRRGARGRGPGFRHRRRFPWPACIGRWPRCWRRNWNRSS